MLGMLSGLYKSACSGEKVRIARVMNIGIGLMMGHCQSALGLVQTDRLSNDIVQKELNSVSQIYVRYCHKTRSIVVAIK